MTRSTFAVPALLALATLLGLFAALTGDGWRDAAGWSGLALPVVAVGWAVAVRRRARRFTSTTTIRKTAPCPRPSAVPPR